MRSVEQSARGRESRPLTSRAPDPRVGIPSIRGPMAVSLEANGRRVDSRTTRDRYCWDLECEGLGRLPSGGRRRILDLSGAFLPRSHCTRGRSGPAGVAPRRGSPLELHATTGEGEPERAKTTKPNQTSFACALLCMQGCGSSSRGRA